MKAEQLRKSILQMAIQGKLVPQDPNDEPASVLLEKIRTEKQRLIKEGKIKKDKVDSIIFKGEDNRYYEKIENEIKDITDEIDFELPNGWEFTRINALVRIQTGASFKKEQASNDKTKVRVLRGGNILNGFYSFFDNDLFIDRSLISDSILLRENDLLTPAVTSIENIGKLALIDRNYDNMTAGGFVFIIRPIWVNSLFAKYLLYSLQSAYFNKQMKAITKKSGQAFYNLGKERLIKLILPLPPLAEQDRIVSEIEKYEPLIAEYDNLEQQKSKLDDEIYDKLRKSILQYAIQGKLVPQDKNDEPASELLKKIRTEKKAQLGKKYVESYIYKGDDNCYYEKVGNNEPVLLENLPFEIPNSWAWTRLENAVIINPRNNITDDTEISFVEMKSIQEGFNNSFVYKILQWKSVKSGFTHFQNNDIGFAKITPCFQNRKSCIFQDLKNGFGAGTTELHILRAYPKTISADYLLLFVKTPYFIEYGKQNFSGTAGQQRVGTSEVKNTLLPIPPINEQLKIIKQVKQLFTNIEKDES